MVSNYVWCTIKFVCSACRKPMLDVEVLEKLERFKFWWIMCTVNQLLVGLHKPCNVIISYHSNFDVQFVNTAHLRDRYQPLTTFQNEIHCRTLNKRKKKEKKMHGEPLPMNVFVSSAKVMFYVYLFYLLSISA